MISRGYKRIDALASVLERNQSLKPSGSLNLYKVQPGSNEF
jgi:hypothetical protein